MSVAVSYPLKIDKKVYYGMVLFANAGHARLDAPARLCSPPTTATNPTRDTYNTALSNGASFLSAMCFVSPVTPCLFQVCIHK